LSSSPFSVREVLQCGGYAVAEYKPGSIAWVQSDQCRADGELLEPAERFFQVSVFIININIAAPLATKGIRLFDEEQFMHAIELDVLATEFFASSVGTWEGNFEPGLLCVLLFIAPTRTSRLSPRPRKPFTLA
jgi:hypothetical protein